MNDVRGVSISFDITNILEVSTYPVASTLNDIAGVTIESFLLRHIMISSIYDNATK